MASEFQLIGRKKRRKNFSILGENDDRSSAFWAKTTTEFQHCQQKRQLWSMLHINEPHINGLHILQRNSCLKVF